MSKSLIYIAENYTEAHMLQDNLKDLGISAILSGQHLTSALGELPAHILFTRVYVNKKDVQKAKKFIDEYKYSLSKLMKNKEKYWKCKNCSETVPSNFINCWNCNKENKK